MKGFTFDFAGWLDQDTREALVTDWAGKFVASVNLEDEVHRMELMAAFDAGWAGAVEAGEHGLAKV